MINRSTLVGRLTKDPELRYTSNNVATVQFTIAVNRSFTNQAGEREADFVPCIAWRKQAENLANFMQKGALVGVDGRLQTRTYEAQDGSKRFVMEVVAEQVHFLESKKREQAPLPEPPRQTVPGQSFSNANIEISDDDLPF